MVVISTRSILVDEEVCVTYHDLSKPGVTRKEGLLRSHTFEASGALGSLGQHFWKHGGNMFLMIIRFSLYCAAYLLSHGVWQLVWKLVLEVGFWSWLGSWLGSWFGSLFGLWFGGWFSERWFGSWFGRWFWTLVWNVVSKVFV